MEPGRAVGGARPCGGVLRQSHGRPAYRPLDRGPAVAGGRLLRQPGHHRLRRARAPSRRSRHGRRPHAKTGCRIIPGGEAEAGETPRQCAERECWEERAGRLQSLGHLVGVRVKDVRRAGQLR
ncbi:NUDIX domain-containing protein [Streptomyces klenkii]|uniref:NUDIX domain-containing protein n=1 Tax=Streptomyces klenkii TaxID=1420899 RepID=A0A3B0B1L8_9ACTN|nr:NUDIX domain-containing protein [Streptomyces klenkii]